MTTTSFHDHYSALGIVFLGDDPSSISLKTINSAYRRVAREYHPDKSNVNADRFQSALTAVQTLRDHGTRAKYDDTYRIRRAEAKRMELEDAKTKLLRLDLMLREKEIKVEDPIKGLRKETEEVLFGFWDEQESRERMAKANAAFVTFEEHCKKEKSVLDRVALFTGNNGGKV